MSKVSNSSENEDDPEVYESSGNEWSSSDKQKNSSNRRASKRLNKKSPRAAVDEEEEEEDSSESTEDEDSDNENPKKRSKNGMNKKQKTTTNSSGSESKARKVQLPKTIYSNEYSTGSFVILKKDAQVGDPSKHPCIWRIDGKALLQKFEAFDEDDKVLHKNTSIYTGWSALDMDLYAAVTVNVIKHGNQDLIVELHWDKLKSINMDSD